MKNNIIFLQIYVRKRISTSYKSNGVNSLFLVENILLFVMINLH